MSFIHEIEVKDIPENVVNEAKGCFRYWLSAEIIIQKVKNRLRGEDFLNARR